MAELLPVADGFDHVGEHADVAEVGIVIQRGLFDHHLHPVFTEEVEHHTLDDVDAGELLLRPRCVAFGVIARALADEHAGQLTADSDCFVGFGAGVVWDVGVAFAPALEGDAVVERGDAFADAKQFAQLLKIRDNFVHADLLRTDHFAGDSFKTLEILYILIHHVLPLPTSNHRLHQHILPFKRM